ncbi:MAG: hypothetical protein NTV34_20110 [Proteobacteria bacterium]|nr:hypothetical protein [Pseudomonadota bacterium]
MTKSLCFVAASIAIGSVNGYAQLQKAPPAFDTAQGRAVPMDISTAHVVYDFQVAQRKVVGRASVKFEVAESGFPFFHIKPSVKAVKLDGQVLEANQLALVAAPENATKLSVLRATIEPGTVHVLDLDFELNGDDVTFSGNSVRCGFFMNDLGRSDLGGQRFFEQYGPGNMEYDQIEFSFDVKVTGTSVAHRVFTNGTFAAKGRVENQWQISFPSYFTSSSIYFHIGPENAFSVAEGTFNGLERDIPVLVYAETQNAATSNLNQAMKYLSELEKTFGATLHRKFVIYTTSSFPGGMEHSGATITDNGSLSHELSHSWFARGIMPAEGNAGWIDEAIASWRDQGYPARSTNMNLTVNLANFSPFRRSTPEKAYYNGADLISALNLRYASLGGMKALLSKWFAETKGTTVTTGEFKEFLEAEASDNLDAVFKARVYGNHRYQTDDQHRTSSRHPLLFTLEKYKSLR